MPIKTPPAAAVIAAEMTGNTPLPFLMSQVKRAARPRHRIIKLDSICIPNLYDSSNVYSASDRKVTNPKIIIEMYDAILGAYIKIETKMAPPIAIIIKTTSVLIYGDGEVAASVVGSSIITRGGEGGSWTFMKDIRRINVQIAIDEIPNSLTAFPCNTQYRWVTIC